MSRTVKDMFILYWNNSRVGGEHGSRGQYQRKLENILIVGECANYLGKNLDIWDKITVVEIKSILVWDKSSVAGNRNVVVLRTRVLGNKIRTVWDGNR